MKLSYSAFVFVVLIMTSFVSPVNPQKVKDYLHVPGPVEFNQTKYNLAWSAHPNATYYKQEYLPAGQSSEKFTKMIMIEAVTGDLKLPDVVKAKTTELDERKSIDKITNYKLIQNKATGEYLLDFVISSGDIVEWNAYRYSRLNDKSGKKGIMLYAYSRRAYGNATTKFLEALKTDRSSDINSLAAYKTPQVTL